MDRCAHTFTRWTPRHLPSLPRDVLPAGAVAYLDIETTGLAPASAQVTLVGLAWGEKGGRRLKQYFVDRPRSEPAVLRKVAADLGEFAGTVTYNGTSFDLPFLRQRARSHGVRWPWVETFDLLRVARAWRQRHGLLRNCGLKTVMSHFRIGRTDDTTGYEMVEAYWRWLETRHAGERDLILEHNAQDVMLLPDIVPHLLRAPSSGGRTAKPRVRG